MTEKWEKITDWDDIVIGEEVKVVYRSTGGTYMRKIKSKIIDKGNEYIVYDSNGLDIKSSFLSGNYSFYRRAKQKTEFKRGYKSFSGIDISTKPSNLTNDKYPHQCPKCGAQSYNCPISGKVDCSTCKG